MLKKSVSKYLSGTKEEILFRVQKVKDIKISTVSSPVSRKDLLGLCIPHLPDVYSFFVVSETIIENLPRARQDIICLMTLSSPDAKYVRSVILLSAFAPFGRLYGYYKELPK